MHSPRRALVAGGTLIALLGSGTAANAAGVRAAGSTVTRTAPAASRAAKSVPGKPAIVTRHVKTVTGQATIRAGGTAARVTRQAHVERAQAKVSRADRAQAAATGIDAPMSIAQGADGALWFTNEYGHSIGRITTGGTITTFTSPLLAKNYPEQITAGPDGTLWFTSLVKTNIGDSIGEITTSGTITLYTGSGIDIPGGITEGPDGAMWFANGGATGTIGRITTGGTITLYTLTDSTYADGITVGPDGALWFTTASYAIGRMTTSGTVTYLIAAQAEDPTAITVGSDGALWMVDNDAPAIERITTTGAFTAYGTTGTPEFITSGPDGALWFTETTNWRIGQLTTSGTMTEYSNDDIDEPSGITAGPDGALWYTNMGDGDDGSIGRVTTSGTFSIYGAVASTTLVASPNPSRHGKPVTFEALIFPSDGGGTVTFRYAGKTIGGCSGLHLTLVNASYQVNCVTSSLPVGTYKVKAIYSGDSSFAGSTGTVTQVIKAA
jgi:virginiamycin B lyase